MKKQITKLGFTLIELLVVITIIGILATGATAVYTSQIQKARDSNRVTDIKALQSAFEQAYADNSVYPEAKKGDTNCEPTTSGSFGVGCLTQYEYLAQFTEDSKLDQLAAKKANQEYLMYMYNVGKGSSGVEYQTFEVSTAFEATASLKTKANDSKDAGNDPERYETGNNLDLDTKYESATGNGCDEITNNGIKITEACEL